MASVIDLLTGAPIDFEVLSNFCFKCKIAEDHPENEEWKIKHAQNCTKNFDGTAGAMEVECAKRLLERFVKKHKLCYTTILCDGDSKAFDAVTELKVYGEDVTITKADCINHASKRMETALRELVAQNKSKESSISGKGKLTQDKIATIQNYYGKAIKGCSSDVIVLEI